MRLARILRAAAAGLHAMADALDPAQRDEQRAAGLRIEGAAPGTDLEPYTTPDVEDVVLRVQSAALGTAFRAANKTKPYRA